jgi:hypothetical protein
MFVRWITSLFSGRRRGDAATSELSLLLQRAHVHLQSEEYDDARALLLQVIAARDSIADPNTIAYTLDALDTTWLFTERYEEGIAFFSEYIRKRHAESRVSELSTRS